MIGSDVPFFIRGGLSLIKGKGDIVKPINYQHPMWFVLIFSEYSLLNKTSRMYQILRECNFGNGTETQTLLRDINSNRCILDFRLFNTFNDISEKLFPNISKLIQKIEDTMELKFILSGSGPTLFCKMMTEVQARHVCSYLEENMNLQAIVVRSIRGIMK
jgi:4-diphosphocytidyl-2-C-methyl-D-erythritol kinase